MAWVASYHRAYHENHCGYEHQGRSREDDRRGQPCISVRRRRKNDAVVGLGSARSGDLYLRCEPNPNASAKKLVSGKRELPELLAPSGYERLDVLPSDLSYRNFDVHLSARKHPTERLLKMSRTLRDVYAALFLDCPPGISLLSENVLRAADAVIVPLLPTPLSVRMLIELRDFVAASRWTDVALLPFFSMVDQRKSLHHDVIASTRNLFPNLLTTEVPYSSAIERMSLRRAPIPSYAPRSTAGQIYSLLWEEIEARMKHSPSNLSAPVSDMPSTSIGVI